MLLCQYESFWLESDISEEMGHSIPNVLFVYKVLSLMHEIQKFTSPMYRNSNTKQRLIMKFEGEKYKFIRPCTDSVDVKTESDEVYIFRNHTIQWTKDLGRLFFFIAEF